MEADGQGGKALSKPAAQPQEQSSIHLGHFARHLPTFEVDYFEVRG